jgi:four helix bundle protein
MSKIKDFYQLKAWEKSHQLTILIYKITKDFPKEEKYGLTDQLRRAASSSGANIAEGFGRYHFADKAKFYYQARGSLKEVQNFIFLAKDLDHLDGEKAEKICQEIKSCEMLINGLIRSVNKQKRVVISNT